MHYMCVDAQQKYLFQVSVFKSFCLYFLNVFFMDISTKPVFFFLVFLSFLWLKYFSALVCKYTFMYISTLVWSVQGSVFHVFALFFHLMNKMRWNVSKMQMPNFISNFVFGNSLATRMRKTLLHINWSTVFMNQLNPIRSVTA